MKHPRSWARHLLDYVVVLGLALLVALGLRVFVVQLFFVPSGSMQPTVQAGDRIVAEKVGYKIRRGDIVVFRRVPADTNTDYSDLVKRVIGLPGETISSRGDTVLINGRVLLEPWLPALTGVCAEASLSIPLTHITANHYFVMGDCRGISDDSRYWGTVPASYVVGKVVAVIWRSGRPCLHWF